MQYSAIGLIFLIFYLAAIFSTFLWFRKVKRRGEKIPLKAKVFAVVIVLMGPSIILTALSPNPTPTSENSGPRKFRVSVESANVRECPLLSCKVIDQLSLNTELSFPEDLFDKYPEWAEVTFQDGKVGYVSKSTLTTEESDELRPKGNEIMLTKWTFDPLEVGGSYGISFCLPVSARSGATCGGQAGETQTPVGGSPPYSFVKSSGFLPPGMSLELNGLLSGSPTTAGTYNFKLCAKDLSMNQGCQNYTLVVKKEGASSESGQTIGSVNLDITVDSITCRLAYQDDYDRLVFDVSLSGTASGPVGAYFSSGSSAPDERYTAAERGSGLANISAGVKTNSWTGESRDTRDSSNERVTGDPAETSWEMWGRAVHLYGEKSTMTRIHLSLYGGGPEKRIFKDVMCSL